MSNILEVEGLTKKLGNFKLNNISFSLPEGCITGFIGVNGAGKTTTIKLILGLIPGYSGTIKIFGKDVRKNERELKNHIGVVFDEGYFYEEMTLEEMKSVVAPAYSSWDETEYKKLIKYFELNPNQVISTLSKGMRMKYSIALAMSHHAELLIMDEPTSGLDPMVRSELMDILLRFMTREGKSVFFSSHITSDLDKVGDMIVQIDRGEIVLKEEKDLLLDSHFIVKGDISELNENVRKLFITVKENIYGFRGITREKQKVNQLIKSAVFERPVIEDIMLAYVRGE